MKKTGIEIIAEEKQHQPEKEERIIIDANFILSKEQAELIYDKIDEIHKQYPDLIFTIQFAVDV